MDMLSINQVRADGLLHARSKAENLLVGHEYSTHFVPTARNLGQPLPPQAQHHRPHVPLHGASPPHHLPVNQNQNSTGNLSDDDLYENTPTRPTHATLQSQSRNEHYPNQHLPLPHHNTSRGHCTESVRTHVKPLHEQRESQHEDLEEHEDARYAPLWDRVSGIEKAGKKAVAKAAAKKGQSAVQGKKKSARELEPKTKPDTANGKMPSTKAKGPGAKSGVNRRKPGDSDEDIELLDEKTKNAIQESTKKATKNWSQEDETLPMFRHICKPEIMVNFKTNQAKIFREVRTTSHQTQNCNDKR